MTLPKSGPVPRGGKYGRRAHLVGFHTTYLRTYTASHPLLDAHKSAEVKPPHPRPCKPTYEKKAEKEGNETKGSRKGRNRTRPNGQEGKEEERDATVAQWPRSEAERRLPTALRKPRGRLMELSERVEKGCMLFRVSHKVCLHRPPMWRVIFSSDIDMCARTPLCHQSVFRQGRRRSNSRVALTRH